MASLMDMRELGMLRNATQRMDRGGGMDGREFAAEEYRRKMEAEEEARKKSMIAQAMALNAENPRYQELMSGASGGPAAVGSVGNVVKSLPFLRHGVPIARGAKSAAQTAKRALWTPGAKPKVNRITGSQGKTTFETSNKGTSGRPSGAAITAIEAAALGGGGYVANRAGLLGASPERSVTPQEVMEPGLPGAGGAVGLPQEKTYPFSPDMLEAVRSGGAKHHEGMPTLEAKEKLASTAINEKDETEEIKPNLWKTWGSLADNPKERKKAYLDSIKKIYMKKMLLDGIAQLTGGVSQGNTWSAMAIAELDSIEKFDSEERTHNQWKALFFNEDGTYNPPKNRKDAMERGQKLGYTSAQLADILSIFPKAKSDIPLQQNIEYILSLPEGSTKTALMIKHGLMEAPEKDAKFAAGALEKNIEYLKSSFDFSDETIKKIIEMQVGLRAKAGTARDSKLQEYLYNIWRVEGQAAGGGVKKTHASFAIWLESPAGQATVQALTGGQSSNSNVITEGDIDWGNL